MSRTSNVIVGGLLAASLILNGVVMYRLAQVGSLTPAASPYALDEVGRRIIDLERRVETIETADADAGRAEHRARVQALLDRVPSVER